jgi:hypothetical protein
MGLNMSKGFSCPHCRSVTGVRTSREITITVREQYHACSNVFCGATFKVQLSVIGMISPSAVPNERLRIPMLPASKPPPAANDDQLEIAATG